MTKGKMIKRVEELLKEAGFTNQDYAVSLQGPTLILAKSGGAKLSNDLILKADLMHLGIEII